MLTVLSSLVRLGGLAVASMALFVANATAQQTGRVFPYKWPIPVPFEEITTADIQHALVWTRHYWGATDGSYGNYTRGAVKGWLASKGYPPGDTLSRDQAVELVTEGLRQRDFFGWALLTDDAVGFSVGIPTKLTEMQAPIWRDGGLQYASYGVIGHFVSVFPTNDGCGSFDSLYEVFTASVSGQREVTYKARKDDWFVVSGEAGARRFYRRMQCRAKGFMTAVINAPTEQVEALGFLFTAMSNSFTVRHGLNPQAKPAPRLEFPPLPPGVSVAATPTGRAASNPNQLDIDRAGKTSTIRLILADGVELRARDIFERVAEAVYVVQTPDAQGSAVAISEQELLTNCHVLGGRTVAILERDGQRIPARLTSANPADDRCILTSNTPLRKSVRVRPFADIKVGERAFTVGAPQGFDLTIAEGIVSSKRVIDGDRLLQTSAPISKGSSGGGLFDGQGHLLGITTWMRKDAQNLNFAIAAEEYAK